MKLLDTYKNISSPIFSSSSIRYTALIYIYEICLVAMFYFPLEKYNKIIFKLLAITIGISWLCPYNDEPK